MDDSAEHETGILNNHVQVRIKAFFYGHAVNILSQNN